MKVIVYNHTHWDREWYKTFQEFRLRFVEVMDLIIREIQNENIDCFYLDGQTVILEDYFELYPENKPLIKNLISKNKIIIGPWYALADEFLVSGESLFRNMLIGVKQAQELGCNKFIGYLPDSFGHSSEIPRILSTFGIKNAVLWRGAGSQKSEFVWSSEDNSSVVATYLIEGYFQNILHMRSGGESRNENSSFSLEAKLIHYDISIEEKAEKLKEFLDKIKEYSATDYILLPMGGDHLGAVLGLKKQLEEIEGILNSSSKFPCHPEQSREPAFLTKCQKRRGRSAQRGIDSSGCCPQNDNVYSFEPGGVFEYIEKVEQILTAAKQPQNDGLAEFKGELRDNSRNPILPGTLSTRLYLKQKNAVSTWKLSKLAEPFYSYLQAAGFVPARNNELEYAWKLLLKNHPHDSICGCSIDEVHDEMMPRFAQVNQISDGLILRGQNAVSQLVNKDSFWVYNASDYEFSGIISIKTNKTLPKSLEKQFIKSTREFPKEILLDTQRPPFSEDIEEFKEYFVYVENIKPHSINIINEDSKYSKPLDAVEIQKNFIKNSHIKIAMNSDGTLKFIDFELKKEFDGLHYFYNRADIGDTYNYSPLENDKPLKAKFIKTEIIENGKLRSTLRIYYELDIPAYFDEAENRRSLETYKTIITTDISVSAGSKRAEFSTSWENKSKDHILQVKFAFNEEVKETHAENTFGIIKREFAPDYSLKEQMPVPKGLELKTNTAPMQRFVWTQGLGVITEGLFEYGVSKNELYITALRAVGKLSKLSLNTRNFPAGPPLDTNGAQCLGKNTVRYAICAAKNPVELFKESDEFLGNIIAEVGNNNDVTDLSLQREALASTRQSQNHTKLLSLLKTNNKNIYTYAIKLPDKGDGVVLRLMNLSNKEQKVSLETDLSFSSYVEVNGMEENLFETAQIVKELVFKSYELKNILLKNG